MKSCFGFGKLFCSFVLICAMVQPVLAFELNIAHINDHHSNLRPFSQVLEIQGIPTRVELGGFGRLATLFKQTQDSVPHLLKLHAGDALVGTPYFTFFKGKTDAEAMNVVCFDAFALGNHEFDGGESELKNFLDFLQQDPLCSTPVLSANVLPALGTPLNPVGGRPYIQPFIVKEVDGVKVGIIGLTVKGKTQSSSRPLATTVFEDEAPAAQRAIDTLNKLGVRHIVLMSHLGYEQDLKLASQLSGLDVIIGGDSHTLLGDFSAVGVKNSQGPYPTVLKNKSGEMVCIGQAWEYSKVYALMSVSFNPEGVVQSCSGQASLVLGPTFSRVNTQGKWETLSGLAHTTTTDFLMREASVRVAFDSPEFLTRLQPYDLLYEQHNNIELGKLQADQSLCLVRVPGTTNKGGPICQGVEKRAAGSDAAQVVAEAFRLAYEAGIADIGLINAGNVRVALETDGQNDLILTNATILTLQPFTNELYLLKLTGREIVTSMEEGVANWLDLKRSDGSHPYASGLRWDLDLTRPRGERFSRVEVKNHRTAEWQPIQPERMYSLVVTDYLAQGFENYTTFLSACQSAQSGRCLTVGSVFADQSISNYVTGLKGDTPAKKILRRLPCEEYSHQRVVTPNGLALTPACKP